MSISIRITDELYEQAKNEALVENRTIAGQVEFWATVGRAAIDNPDLPVNFIIESLLALKEDPEHYTPFLFSEN